MEQISSALVHILCEAINGEITYNIKPVSVKLNTDSYGLCGASWVVEMHEASFFGSQDLPILGVVSKGLDTFFWHV